jgi:two-component system, chemotaxis family, protein-glutamate methylesterase/glutaminase
MNSIARPKDAEADAEAGDAAAEPPARPRSAGEFDVVVVGASAGGLPALQQLVAALPAGYGGAVFIAVHMSPQTRSELATILARSGPLPVLPAADGLPVVPGYVRVAPADHHLLLEPGVMRVVRGPRENRHRPAIDPLFRSAAWAYGPRAVGVVLSGNLDDGTAGLWAIKSCGGTTVVQDPGEAQVPDMPANALKHNRVDHRLVLADIAALLAGRDRRPPHAAAAASGAATAPAAAPARVEVENEMSIRRSGVGLVDRLGLLSPFTCPGCGGALWELEDGNGQLRYRCHTGHAYTQSDLLIDQNQAVEEGLYRALRAVQEKAMALRRLAERWPEQLPAVRDDYLTRAEELDETAGVLRRVLSGGCR